jgi:hypothetical protein
MDGLDKAITALDAIASAVQAVPILGESFKLVVSVGKKICETVKVRMPFQLSSMCSASAQKMKENREAYETIAGRAVQLLATVANTLMKAGPDKLRGMEANVARLRLCVRDVITVTHLSDHNEQHTGGYSVVD